jgi:hypothetical protein
MTAPKNWSDVHGTAHLTALHRSFPEAGDGRPLPPMGDELMTAGLSANDARFVAVQLAQNGYLLVQADEVERLRARAKELEALLREAREDLANAAENEYPKRLRDIYPSMARYYAREMDLPFRIDAALIDKETGDD